MISENPIPQTILAQLKLVLARDEKVRFHLDSDLGLDLSFGQRWLIVTDRRVLVTPPSNGRKFDEVALSEVKEAEVVPVVGGGFLRVKTAKGMVPLLHYSNSLSAHFAEAAKGINQLAKGKPLLLSTELKRDRCAKCGRLLPNVNERCPFCIRYLEVMGRILQYIRPYAWYTLFAVSLTLVSTALMLVGPLVTKHIVDDALLGRNVELLVKLVLLLVGVRVIQTVIAVYNGKQLAWLAGRMGTDVRSHVFRCVENLTMKFFDRRHVGNIMSRVMNDSDRLQGFLIEGFPFFAQNILLFAGGITILGMHSAFLTALVTIPVPVMFLGQFLFWKYVRILGHKANNQLVLLNTRLAESVQGVRVVKSFSAERRETSRFDRQNDRWFEAQYIVEKIWSMFHPGMSFFVQSGMLIVYYVGGLKVIGIDRPPEMTLGTLMMFTSFLWMLYGPLQWLTAITNWMTRAFTGAERIFEIIDTTPEVYEPPDAVAVKSFRGEVEFKDVTFSYEKGKPAIKNMSFKVKPGEMIGLVGKSGSGKSTLLALLCRFYTPDEGRILVDGIPLGKIRLEDLRRNIGLVLQESFLFGSSVYENISYSKPESPAEVVINAARAANAHEFIMTRADAYDTKVGERGNRLSGGEKQRLSIARAILHNPSMLVLDEATSSVDSETEAKIQEAVERLVKNRTTFVAAHRLSTLRNADRVFVLDEGELAESGSHNQLMAREGIYYRLVKAQEEAWRRAKKHLSIGGGPGHG